MFLKQIIAIRILRNARDFTLNAILIYHNHPGILAIKEKTRSVSVFTFNHITKDVMKKIKYLDVSKASQENDNSTK